MKSFSLLRFDWLEFRVVDVINYSCMVLWMTRLKWQRPIKTNITGHSALWVPTQSRYLFLLSGCVAKIQQYSESCQSLKTEGSVFYQLSFLPRGFLKHLCGIAISQQMWSMEWLVYLTHANANN